MKGWKSEPRIKKIGRKLRKKMDKLRRFTRASTKPLFGLFEPRSTAGNGCGPTEVWPMSGILRAGRARLEDLGLVDSPPSRDKLSNHSTDPMHRANILNPVYSVRYDDGIYIDVDWVPSGVTNQFLDAAKIYHERYFYNAYWNMLIERALQFAKVDLKNEYTVLDVGSGSGNTVFATINALNSSRIIASDISPQLLRILVDICQKSGVEDRVETYCFDLHKDLFRKEVFDIVIGGAIMHHMLDPEAAISNASKWLRPGGSIILFEPLEIGSHALAAVYHSFITILDHHVHHELVGFLKAMIRDFEVRFGAPRINQFTRNLDDKWLFTPYHLQAIAGRLSLKLESINPLRDDLSTLFLDALKGHLVAGGKSHLEIPHEIVALARTFDAGMSSEIKRYFIPEGIVIMRK